MPEKFSSTCEEAVLEFDLAFNSGRTSDVYDIMSKANNSYHIEVLKISVDRMGLDIFRRNKNTFIGKSSEDGLDRKHILLTRKATMFDDTECRETFLTQKNEKGWQVVVRKSIELTRPLSLQNFDTVMSYDGDSWNVFLYAPWINTNIKISMSTDRISDERGPTKNQIEILNEIVTRKESFIDELGESTLLYVKETLGNWLGDDWFELSHEELLDEGLYFTFSKPTTPSEALQTILPPYSILIAEDVEPKQSTEFSLYVENKCDLEHGLVFLIKDWKIIEYGQQG